MKKNKLYVSVLNAVSLGFFIDADVTGLLINDGKIIGQLEGNEDTPEIVD